MIYTVGHSIHTAQAFVDLLAAYRVVQLADVRSAPRSRRHPHFNRAALNAFLAANGMRYRHFPELGGLRAPRPDSPNSALQHPAFRGYADHMATVGFGYGLEALLDFSGESRGFPPAERTAVMCAEALWWKCHRRLLSDALVVRGVPVVHILSSHTANPHELWEFARPTPHGVTYPGLL